MRHTAAFMSLTLICLLLNATPALAQRNEATLEASVLRGTVGYARVASPRTLIGVELGFGFPEMDRQLQPREDPETGSPDFEEYLHLGVFLRLKLNENFEVDSGLRGSIADLWPCGASDCWPQLFGGAYLQPMVGWRRVKFGARLTGGWINETEPGPDGQEGNTFVVSLAPLLIRATLPW